MSTATAPEPPAEQNLEPDTVELHVRNVPRAVWLKARNAALVSRLRFGQYVIKLLENAGPVPLPQSSDPNASHPGGALDGHSPDTPPAPLDLRG